MKLYSVVCVLVLLISNSEARPQDLPSGPPKGEKAPELKVLDLTGEHKDKEVDYVGDREDKPTLFLFVNAEKWDRPMARFLRQLDDAVKKDDANAHIVAVWLTANEDQTKEYLPRVQQSLQLQATALTCHTGDQTGPKGWNINNDAHLSVVVVNKGRISTNFGYRAVNETDVPAVREALRKAKEPK